MSCNWCAKFLRQDFDIAEIRTSTPEERSAAEGECRLGPSPVTVTGHYCCSSFQWAMDEYSFINKRMSPVASLFVRMHERSRYNEGLSAEIRKLKKANHDLRQKLKALKAKA
jgi:hypothetical protein